MIRIRTALCLCLVALVTGTLAVHPAAAARESGGGAPSAESTGTPFPPVAELTTGGGEGGGFGASMAVSGDTAIIGAPRESVAGRGCQGAAYVFVRSGDLWVLAARLTAADGAAGDGFGAAVALDGDVALVGAPWDDVGDLADRGSVSVFVRSGDGWDEQDRLTRGGAGTCFGAAVALSADTALIGAPCDDSGGEDYQGSAWVFVREESGWSPQAQIAAADGAADDCFGYAVALDGGTALLGAPGRAVAGKASQGAAYVYARADAEWRQEARLVAADGAGDDGFGCAVALDGDAALVGAPYDRVGAREGQGSASVFARVDAIWTQQTQLVAADGAAFDHFGGAVALDGAGALVGAPGDDVEGSASQGSALLFSHPGTSWTQRLLTAGGAGAHGGLGAAVALAAGTALAGAPYADVDGHDDQGAGFAFPWSAAGVLMDESPPATGTGWHAGPVEVTLAATDGGPGGGRVFYRIGESGDFRRYDAADRLVIDGEGTTILWLSSDGEDGSVGDTVRAVVRIDGSAPVTHDDYDGQAHRAVTIDLRPEDPLSGPVATFYRIDGGEWQSGDAAVLRLGVRHKRPGLGAGTHALEYYSVDIAGNVETPGSVAVWLDGTSADEETASGARAIPQGGGRPVERARNVIVMIADGMGYNQMYAADLYEYGAAGAQPFERFPVSVSMSTYSVFGGYDPLQAWGLFSYLTVAPTDSAAAATAMATGVKTYDAAVGVGLDGGALWSVAQEAEQTGRATGVVTSVQWSHATPAGFVAHNVSRDDYPGIAREMISASATDVIMGAGNPWFDNDGRRRVAPDYSCVGGLASWNTLLAGQAGGDADGDGDADPWTLVESKAGFDELAAAAVTPPRVCGTAQVATTLQQRRGGDAFAAPGVVPANANVPDLSTMTRAALNVLDADDDGFFLMVEGGAVDWAAHAHQPGRMVEEQLAFDAAVAAVTEWVSTSSDWGETLLIVTGDHETGYLWGPGSGAGADGAGQWAPLVSNGSGELPTMQFASCDHTNSLIPLFAKGPAAHHLRLRADGVDAQRGEYLDNTELAGLIAAALR